MSYRERLRKKLIQKGFCFSLENVDALTDWVIADRKKIVEPIRLAKEYRISNGGSWLKGLRTNDAISASLKMAGVE